MNTILAVGFGLIILALWRIEDALLHLAPPQPARRSMIEETLAPYSSKWQLAPVDEERNQRIAQETRTRIENEKALEGWSRSDEERARWLAWREAEISNGLVL